VVVNAVVRLRVGVDECARQAREGVHEVVFGVHGDPVGFHECGARVDDDVTFGAEAVADPTQPYRAHVQDARCGGERVFGLVDEGGVHRVHEAVPDLSRGLPQDEQDRQGDEEADDGVRPGEFQGDSCGA
jgi:hypothetical protein